MGTFDIVLNSDFSVSDNRLYKAKPGAVEFDSVKHKIKIDGFDDLIEEGERDTLKGLLFKIQQGEGSRSSSGDVEKLNEIFEEAIKKADTPDKQTKLVELYNAIIDGFAGNQSNVSKTRLEKQQAFMDKFDQQMKTTAQDTFTKNKEVNSEKAFTYLALHKDEITNFLKSNSGETVSKDKLSGELKTLLDIANNDGKKLNNILHATEKDRSGNDKGFNELKDYEIRIDGDKVKISKKAPKSDGFSSAVTQSNSGSNKATKTSRTKSPSSNEGSGEDEDVAESDGDGDADTDTDQGDTKLKSRLEKLTKIEEQIEFQLGIGNSGFKSILAGLSPTNKEKISNLTERVTMLEEALGESAGGEEFSDSDSKEERLDKIEGKLKYLAKGLSANLGIAANLRNSYAQRSNNGMFRHSQFGSSPYTGGFQGNGGGFYGNNGGFQAGIGFQNCNGGFHGGIGFSGRMGMRGGGGMGLLLNNPKYSDLAAGWIIGGAIGSRLGNLASAFINRNNSSNYYNYGGCPSFPPYMPPSGCYGLYT